MSPTNVGECVIETISAAQKRKEQFTLERNTPCEQFEQPFTHFPFMYAIIIIIIILIIIIIM